MNVDFIDENRFLIRLQNISRQKSISIEKKGIEKIFENKKINFKEVDFDFLFND